VSDARFTRALLADNSLPMCDEARDLWVKDLQNPLRVWLLPLLRVTQTLTLHVIYYLKRLIFLQFSAHRPLQWTINFFLKWFVTPEANALILRHMWIESQVLNFIVRNSRRRERVQEVGLAPEGIDDMMRDNFIHHDRELFRVLAELGDTADEAWPRPAGEVDFSALQPIRYRLGPRRWTQRIDFETAHELFKTTFCLLLRADEYEAALNSLQFDQSMCRRVGAILGDPHLDQLAYNRFPLVLHHTNAVSERFVYHGVTLEHLYAYLTAAAARAARGGAGA